LQVLNLLEVFQNFTNVIFPGKLFKFVDKYLPLVAHTLPEPYYSELKGISNLTGIPLGEITLYNIFYELFSVCTSLVAQRTDGHLFHGRNLDFGLLLG
jgi:acid ceramidase